MIDGGLVDVELEINGLVVKKGVVDGGREGSGSGTGRLPFLKGAIINGRGGILDPIGIGILEN